MQMKHQRHYGASLAALKEAEQIKKLIADLDRLVQIIACDIATEEERARVSDRSDAAYPILARVLAARRDNLRDTITALEQRLSSLTAETDSVLELV
jgi:multidrug resistance efflux pump